MNAQLGQKKLDARVKPAHDEESGSIKFISVP
jgi:hypothetical protein